MKVYIVDAGDHGDNQIIDVYASQELAEQFVKDYNSKLVHKDRRGILYNAATFTEYNVKGA